MIRQKPNIVLITTDTQRCDTLRCMGSSWAISPHLDRLAAQGVLFRNAHTSSPVCMPARCSLLTGLHTPTHGCIENGISRRIDVPVFPDYLKQQGYFNLMIGKSHFGEVPASFDVQKILGGEKNRDCDDFYAEFIRQKGYSRKSGYPNPVPEELFVDAFIVDTTIAELEKIRNVGQPFFVHCSLVSPHAPLDPPGSWAGSYDDIDLPPIRYTAGELSKQPQHLVDLLGELSGEEIATHHGLSLSIEKNSPAEMERMRKLYYGLAAYCDAQIGRLLDYLETNGLRENSLIIFSSDHGQQNFDHGFNDKHNYYDESWRVPLILSMSGTLPQGEEREFAIWNDITATILGAAGTSCPTMQGFDLFEPLRQGEPSPRKCAVATLYKSCALASKHWKMEYYFEEGSGRLFDRTADPGETRDLFHQAEYIDIRTKLLKALLTWRCDIEDLAFVKRTTKASGFGHVANRLAERSLALQGTDAEERLNHAIESIDMAYALTVQ